jgi:hypothetical protein
VLHHKFEEIKPCSQAALFFYWKNKTQQGKTKYEMILEGLNHKDNILNRYIYSQISILSFQHVAIKYRKLV